MQRVFGNADRRPDGTVKSEYPAWYWDTQLEELEREVSERRSSISRGIIPSEAMPRYRGDLEAKEARLTKIKEESPRPSQEEKDKLSKMIKEMQERIKESNWKRSEMERGLVDAHEEAKRMSEPCIPIRSDTEKNWAEQCYCRIIDGKVTRVDFERMYKIASKLIGEPTDIEYLRRP
jgi:hypothetical protein